jgi:hypothetical protein
MLAKVMGIIFVIFSASVTGQATSHAFVRNEHGVGLASDSLNINKDGKLITKSQVCKVVISKGRLLFNAGYFQDVRLLMRQEAALPFEDIRVTKKRVVQLLASNHMDMSNDPRNSPTRLVVNSGALVQTAYWDRLESWIEALRTGRWAS